MRFRTPQPRKPERCYSHSATQYTVKHGDTFYSIALRFGISTKDLAMYNRHITNPKFLISGDILCIPNKRSLCSFLYPTKAASKNFYAIVSSLNGITCIANLPELESLDGGYNSYCCYIISPDEYSYVPLSQISKTPSIWLGEFKEGRLEPDIKIIISANIEKEPPKPPGDLLLFESK